MQLNHLDTKLSEKISNLRDHFCGLVQSFSRLAETVYKSLGSWLPSGRRLLLFYLVLAVFCGFFAFQKTVSNDLWKALYTGRYIARTFTFPTHGEFAFTFTKPEVQQRNAWTWLGNLLFYGLWQIGDVTALQVFRWILLLVSLAGLHAIVRFRAPPLVLLLFILTVFGLEQKLLLRNALFLIPGLCCYFYLWYRMVHCEETYWSLGLVLVLVLWGNLHGSYLVGVGLLVLMAFGLGLDKLRGAVPSQPRTLGTIGGATLTSLLGVTYLKPLAPDSQVAEIFRRIWSFGSGGLLNPPAMITSATEQSGGLYQTVKGLLQSTAFSHVSGQATTYSSEFLFPPEHLGELYVSTSVLLLVVGITSFLLTSHRIRFSLLFPFVATSVVGMSYLRTVALIPLTVTALLLIKWELGDFEKIRFTNLFRQAVLITLVILAMILSYRVLNPQFPGDFAPTSYRDFGFGVHPRLSHSVPGYIHEHYRNTPFYNSYNLGSWLIWKWWPDKKVFMDSKNSGYEANFRRDILTKSNNQLVKKYKIDHVLLTLSNSEVYSRYIPDPNWRVLALDQGMIAFKKVEKSSSLPATKPVDRLLLTPAEWNRLPRISRVYLKQILNFLRRFSARSEIIGKYTKPPKFSEIFPRGDKLRAPPELQAGYSN